jgi:hypothetical protein
MFSLDRSSGATKWVSPVVDGTHYQSVSTAAGVTWTVDGDSDLDGFRRLERAGTRAPAAERRRGAAVTNLTGAGVAVAEDKLFVAAGGVSLVAARLRDRLRSPLTRGRPIRKE